MNTYFAPNKIQRVLTSYQGWNLKVKITKRDGSDRELKGKLFGKYGRWYIQEEDEIKGYQPKMIPLERVQMISTDGLRIRPS